MVSNKQAKETLALEKIVQVSTVQKCFAVKENKILMTNPMQSFKNYKI